jgi:hypothetical protein
MWKSTEAERRAHRLLHIDVECPCKGVILECPDFLEYLERRKEEAA